MDYCEQLLAFLKSSCCRRALCEFFGLLSTIFIIFLTLPANTNNPLLVRRSFIILYLSDIILSSSFLLLIASFTYFVSTFITSQPIAAANRLEA